MSTVKLDTLGAVNDLGKPWRYEEDGLTVTRTAVWSPRLSSGGLRTQTLHQGQQTRSSGGR
jgi:hypothetical protein